MKYALTFATIGIVGIAMLVGLMYVSYSNQEVRLKQQIAGQQRKVGVVFDNTWKTINQIAQVSEKYKSAFAKIYPKIMEGRYGNARGGALLSFITEANPNFDTRLYEKLQNAIEGHRATFTNEQSTLSDLKREHDTLRETIPGNWFIGSRPAIEIVLVTSSKTEGVMKTGKDDDVTLP